MGNVITVDGISFAFDTNPNQKILENISFAGEEYEFVSIIGPSGAGKSTLLRIMAGLIRPTGGKVSFYGEEVTGPIPQISFVFQDFALLPWLTNIENVEVGLTLSSLSDQQKERKAKGFLDRLDLKGFENQYPNVLSGGMKQRVGVARALVSDPEVLLMDEPFSSLDELTARSLRSEILKTLKDKAIPLKSVVMVTHNVEEAVELSDKLVIISNKPSKVKEIKKISMPHPRNRHSKEFLNLVDRVYAALAS